MSFFAHSASWHDAISMYGDVKYDFKFQHFDYVNPDAPKGGIFKQASIGSFDSLNPYIVKGNAAAGVSYIYDTLLQQSSDEPFSLYPLVAEKVKVADDFGSVSFLINPNATFQDGRPITAEDVKFSFDILTTEGAPHYRSYYAGVDKVVVDDRLRVTFQFKELGNRELPLIIGQIPILPAHFWKDKDFAKSGLIIPIGSGPYRVGHFDAGKQVVYQRNEGYWAKDLPVNKGRYNFDQLIFDYYRDDAVAFEAFKSGAFDYRLESSSKRWATGYVGEQFDTGQIKLEQIADKNPQGMQGFWFNLRRDKFKDPQVRKAISLLFDFEWANKTLFYNAYTRIESFYSGSELATQATISDTEKAILMPYQDQLPRAVFAPLVKNQTNADGNVRPQMREAVALLAEAGYTLKDSKMQNQQGEQLSFEFLLYSNDFERIIHPFRRNLQRIGIKTNIRLVDISQFINRLNNFQFDLVSLRKGQSISPGNEQASFWGCESANQVGTSNWGGICSPVIDALTNQLITATTRQELVETTKALDRVLLSQDMVIPQWYLPASRIAYWDKFEHPKVAPDYELGIDTWWSKEAISSNNDKEQ
ncbi:extracellular solute-binding protein [Psychromonas sp. 14N.309.X.WAT.B.A12]|uniref:extracellular solute-binding protein n=1 Tax=Psychromonas sp. 14N.309.X.WAT.B.A12 TaxID=2998322 RepID=UPI0025AF0F86|nr:extracellular solute-binding protein [Psychromonas sp. 14N.309.X.WAT.B.A12]MDN2662805.1 extracellular solute-binding protein [Psychromonas sp. 14N.309.X.WAT.B.A12]